jgi:signal recognition particle receptor subunit beta
MRIDWRKQEIIFKIVYFGPGLSGKTTNLEYIHAHLSPSFRSDLLALKTAEGRTLYFDFMQLELGKIKGKKPRFHLYTVAGQIHYAYSRRIILRGCDAVVFVADSQTRRMDENLGSLMDLEKNLIVLNKTLAEFPWVLQYNKRDLADIENIAFLQEKLNFLSTPYHEAVATRGIGVFETLSSVIQLAMNFYAVDV